MTAELVTDLHAALDDVAVDPDVPRRRSSPAPAGASAPGSTSAASATAPHSDHLGPDPARASPCSGTSPTLIPHLRSLPQPVIAAVNGPAAGGGFALVLGSDIRIAARTAKFNAAFIRIGLSACDIGTSLAAAPPRRRRPGPGADADRPHLRRRGGLPHRPRRRRRRRRRAARHGARQGRARSCATRRSASPSPRRACGRRSRSPACRQAIDLENRQQIMASATADHREAMQAFLEKRPPTYTNT